MTLLVRVQSEVRWQGKIDLSGVVQQTLLEAYQAGEQLDDANDAQKAGWLKRALANNLADEIRKLTTARRDAGRERSLQAAMDESVSQLEQLLPAQQASPSQEVVRAERLLRLTAALSELPEAQRSVIELHHLRGQSLAEVAEALDQPAPRSPACFIVDSRSCVNSSKRTGVGRNHSGQRASLACRSAAPFP